MINNADRSKLSETLRWALAESHDPSLASADWLTRDLDADYDSALTMLTDSAVPLRTLRKAKSAFKTMRIVGETPADRRLGARLYLGTIAAGLVHHGQRISRQSDPALRLALQSLTDDGSMAPPLRHLAGIALCVLENEARSAAPTSAVVEDDDPWDLDEEGESDFLAMPE